VLEDHRAVSLHVFDELHPLCSRKQSAKTELPLLKRLWPEIHAVQFKEVEGVQKNARVVCLGVHLLEVCKPIRTAVDALPRIASRITAKAF
jgi:hypothetical protein